MPLRVLYILTFTGFERNFEEAREKSKAASKKSAQGGIKFEAEATGWLQVSDGPIPLACMINLYDLQLVRTSIPSLSSLKARSVPLTNDEPKYAKSDIQAKVLAILTPTGFVDSSTSGSEGPFGLVLDQVCGMLQGWVEEDGEGHEG